MVGRSTRITGPYVDRTGRSLLEGGGTEVLRGYNEFIGTGHPDVYSTGGVDYFVNHYYDATDNRHDLSGARLGRYLHRLPWATSC